MNWSEAACGTLADATSDLDRTDGVGAPWCPATGLADASASGAASSRSAPDRRRRSTHESRRRSQQAQAALLWGLAWSAPDCWPRVSDKAHCRSPFRGRGTNYANGSAQAVSTTQADGYRNGFFNNVPAVAQIANYLAAGHNSANPGALYMICAGTNDLFWMQSQQASLTPQQLLETYMRPWAATLAASVATCRPTARAASWCSF
jgi:hypothetical protein